MSTTKPMSEVGNQFLASLIGKTDEQLSQILKQEFTYNSDGNTYNINNITSVEGVFSNGTSILDESDYTFNGFQILCILAAGEKKISFDLLKNHLEQADPEGMHKTTGFAYYMLHDVEGFDGTLDEAQAIQKNPDSNLIWVPEITAQTLYTLMKAYADDDALNINLSRISYESLRNEIKIVNDTIWVALPIELFCQDNNNRLLIENADSIAKGAFLENCINNPNLINFAIPYKELV